MEEQIERVIDQELSQIDIDEVMANPKQALAQVADNVRDIFLNKYAHDALELGIRFGRAVKKKDEADKTIKIDDSENPKLNAESDDKK